MVIEFGADWMPVVFLTTDNVDMSESDAAMAEGEEELGSDVLPEEEVLGSGDGYVDEMEMTGEGELGSNVLPEEEVLGSGAGYVDGMEMTGEETAQAKDPILSNPVFVGGVSFGVLVVGGVLGFLLAWRKIKKGIEIYEDI